MTVSSDQTSQSPIKRALMALEDLQAKLERSEAAKREPIAIIGMSCRFPGDASNPEAFWELLQSGRDAITEVPSDRWDHPAYYDPDPATPGKTYTSRGAFLSQVDQFDAPFFGISESEARSLDPQQRLVLEVAWEAMEAANQPPIRLQESPTGVFIGICANDYSRLLWQNGDLSGTDAFTATGNALSMAAGRLSYLLGLRGPSLAVDTACSSSLVAIHLACQHLRSGECEQALAGGVHLLLSPESTIAFAKTRMLSPDGRCKSFDAATDGYGRGEGCGMILLKRLSVAQRDGDTVLAVIRGSAVNHNGRSSSLIAPNGLAQQTVIRQALEQGQINPTWVDYVEVQGTGTALGEPIEIGALGQVYGEHRSREQPLRIGSVKTNIGHLEAASGVASLIKVVLAMQHGQIPPHLNLQTRNPHVPWDHLPVEVPQTCSPWTAKQEGRFAGVSAFGFSGTNAHLVLSEAPAAPAPAARGEFERPTHLLTLSAKSAEALQALAECYAQHLQAHPEQSLANLCFTANTGRSHFPYRLCLPASDRATLLQQLQAVATRAPVASPSVAPAVAIAIPELHTFAKTATQTLYSAQPTFRAAYKRCAAALADLSALPAETTHWVASQIALYELWQTLGIEPSMIVAVGTARYLAAHLAGALTLADLVQFLVADSQGAAAVAAITASCGDRPLNTPLVTSHQGDWCLFHACTPAAIAPPATSAPPWETCQAYLTSQDCRIVLVLGWAPTTPSGAVKWLSSLAADGQDWPPLLAALSTLYCEGFTVDWQAFDAGYERQPVKLPTYPWQWRRYWVEAASPAQPTGVTEPGQVTAAIKACLGEVPMTRIQALHQQGRLSAAEVSVAEKVLQLLAQGADSESPEAAPRPDSMTTPVMVKSLTVEDIQLWLASQIARELGVPVEQINLHTRFDSYGLDSMLALSVATAGQRYLGIEVSPLLMVHYPTIAALAQHLAQALETSESEVFEL